tara:strand:- start:2085 stop:2210 length:126 start_codon:yes stop_codon:yes gene_type:complete
MTENEHFKRRIIKIYQLIESEREKIMYDGKQEYFFYEVAMI